MTKKILLVFTTTFPRWNNDTDPPFVFELCRRLKNDFEVFVLTPYYPGSAQTEVMDGIHVRRFKYFLARYEKLAGTTGILPTLKRKRFYYLILPFFLFFSLIALLRTIRCVRPNLIHVHWIIPLGVFAFIAKKMTQVPYVVTAHGADVFGLQGYIFNWLRMLVVRNAGAVTTVSNALKHSLLKEVEISVDDLHVVPMGVDLQMFEQKLKSSEEIQLSRTDKKGKILFVGRLTEKKGVTYLLQAMPEIVQRMPHARLTIVGSGELENQLKSEVYRLDLNEYVTFLGAVPNANLPDIYLKHEVFVAPSVEADSGDTEGFGLTLVEASMAGCLVIGSRIGGIVDIVKERQTGLLVRQKDPQDIVEKVTYALQNSEEATRIAAYGKKNAQAQFDWGDVSRKYAAILSEACS